MLGLCAKVGKLYASTCGAAKRRLRAMKFVVSQVPKAGPGAPDRFLEFDHLFIIPTMEIIHLHSNISKNPC
jgi:hypothetical protein